ncbi:alkaline phosphatase family protein [Aquimarina sp. U1-2]|uniref:alkaline phosphatase PafA n=1 Tax=Aquimarina sp. U1-2 TaxID=2823141 RepID=UPI001AECA094|nr:alkaline phosphatase PafA [Aquimarina sp. U1-2]MBP2830753.1 alkaline phosphatase family protein [Aquimarina sp. U1-2]
MPYVLILLVWLVTITLVNAQHQVANTTKKTKPKLVVGIVVDQMRYDYLTRFYSKFGEGGFKRMMNKGFSFQNHHFDYIPTTTAPGHASIYTGTTPRNHGIIGNIWYDKTKKRKIYCVTDENTSPVGTSSTDGKKSPIQLKVTTITDQNRLHTQMKGKTISIALKDRGAILPGGHTANAAYWFRGKYQGNWISSTYYMQKLPQWVIDFNASDAADRYFKEWNTFFDSSTYVESGPDNTRFERGFKGKQEPVFPYPLQELKSFNKEYDILLHTPFGNSLTVDFTIEAIKEEQLGKDKDTDFLTVSFSSTDYIGHNFGVNSKEIEDTYIRLDKDVERLLTALDIQVGKKSYVVFLTSDHGATHVPSFLSSIKIPSGYFKEASVHLALQRHLQTLYQHDSIIEHISNKQIFLNHDLIHKNQLNTEEIQNSIARYLTKVTMISETYTRSQIEHANTVSTIKSKIKKGFHSKRSGDVCYILNPAVVAYSKTGSMHGSAYQYDTHVPLLFLGTRIKKGATTKKTTVSDIAPTLSALLGIALPNAANGNILSEIIDD